jgi:ATP-binding cassette subfamily D (ALD) protein 3
MDHSSKIMYLKLYMGVFDGFLVKYGSVMAGYATLGLPVFGLNSKKYLESIKNDRTAITRDYVRNSSLLISLAKAIGRMILSYKEI